jgi:polyisoprenoid-binding protein YceI
MTEPDGFPSEDEFGRYTTNAAAPLTEDATVRYVIDARGSTFTVQAFSTGLLSAFGHDPRIAIRDFQGDVEFSPGGATLDDARLQFSIRAGSLEVKDDISEKDREEIQRRMFTEVLDTERFSEIIYECSRVTGSGSGDRYWVVLNGELTLRGLTRMLPFTARLAVNGSSLRASGEFLMKQSDFGIATVTAAAGAIKVKDELKFTFDVVARKQG